MRKQEDKVFDVGVAAMSLALLSISTLFLSLVVSFFYLQFRNRYASIDIPSLFYVSAILIMAASFTITKGKSYFNKRDSKMSYRYLFFTCVLTFFFLISQYLGWQKLIVGNILLANSMGGSFIYILSGVHLVHIIAGLPFLILLAYKGYQDYNDESLSHISNFYGSSSTIKVLNIYWHFLDALWIIILICLLILSNIP